MHDEQPDSEDRVELALRCVGETVEDLVGVARLRDEAVECKMGGVLAAGEECGEPCRTDAV